ncbi:MAG: hypothetical protein ACK5ES_22445, partial [Planctomyces sp.]
PQFECIRHKFGHQLRFVFKRIAVIPTFLQRMPFDEKVERLFLCGDLEPADCGSNECAVSIRTYQPVALSSDT